MYSLLKILLCAASFRKCQQVLSDAFIHLILQCRSISDEIRMVKQNRTEQCKIEQNTIEWHVHVYVNSLNSSPKHPKCSLILKNVGN